jgi:DNA uptake protein ComE-like DNA-binding protein
VVTATAQQDHQRCQEQAVLETLVALRQHSQVVIQQAAAVEQEQLVAINQATQQAQAVLELAD